MESSRNTTIPYNSNTTIPYTSPLTRDWDNHRLSKLAYRCFIENLKAQRPNLVVCNVPVPNLPKVKVQLPDRHEGVQTFKSATIGYEQTQEYHSVPARHRVDLPLTDKSGRRFVAPPQIVTADFEQANWHDGTTQQDSLARGREWVTRAYELQNQCQMNVRGLSCPDQEMLNVITLKEQFAARIREEAWGMPPAPPVPSPRTAQFVPGRQAQQQLLRTAVEYKVEALCQFQEDQPGEREEAVEKSSTPESMENQNVDEEEADVFSPADRIRSTPPTRESMKGNATTPTRPEQDTKFGEVNAWEVSQRLQQDQELRNRSNSDALVTAGPVNHLLADSTSYHSLPRTPTLRRPGPIARPAPPSPWQRRLIFRPLLESSATPPGCTAWENLADNAEAWFQERQREFKARTQQT